MDQETIPPAMNRGKITVDAETLQSAQHFLQHVQVHGGDREMRAFLALDATRAAEVTAEFVEVLILWAKAEIGGTSPRTYFGCKTLLDLETGLSAYCRNASPSTRTAAGRTPEQEAPPLELTSHIQVDQRLKKIRIAAMREFAIADGLRKEAAFLHDRARRAVECAEEAAFACSNRLPLAGG
jgi:hypothetical protein